MDKYNRKDKGYNKKRQSSINFNEDLLFFLRFLKKEGYTNSISESVRQMITFALPFYLQTIAIVKDAPKKKLKNFTFKTPSKLTITELRKLYPEIVDYKFMNENKNAKMSKL